ncbi:MULTISPECIES: hypothetical protein [Mesorhizobium]|uniref:Uncharacterized protein n=1 Tax=Mesorhizobium denitrificans TaxID=2294114 RepID=A0A371XEA8_9HYPH|nr:MULTISPECIES: hypothetical protein [Mesorhizobium]RFC67523.1 hypothetical protein DY251_11030 [Mesorhizobium denitrificans]
MKTIALIALLFGTGGLALSSTSAVTTKAFRLKLGEQSIDIDVGERAEITLPDGSKVRVELTRNEFATYSGEGFTFVHPSDVSVTRSDLGDGVVQHLMTTALGTMVIVQTYDGLDPSTLNEMMLKELTGDAVAAGAKLERKDAKRDVSGKTLSGIVATETLRRDTVDYEIESYGKDDAGVIVITRMDRENAAQDSAKIAKFWETFRLQ